MASEFLIVAERILRDSAVPLSAQEIVDQALDRQLFSDKIAGATPHQTMKSKLSVAIKKQGPQSAFVRSARGRFSLRDTIDPNAVYEAKPFTKPLSTERVLAFPQSDLDKDLSFQGVKKTWRALHKKLLRPEKVTYLDRITAEGTDEFKQVLTYVLVTRGSSVLCYRRGTFTRAEDFLRGSFCIGFGGHVTQEDNTLLSSADLGLIDSARRELMEELKLPEKDVERLLQRTGIEVCGVINDDSSAVGRRHFAFVISYEVSDDPYWDQPIRGERSIAQLHWISLGDGPHAIWKFEYWSQLCLRKYFPSLAKTASDLRVVRKIPFRGDHILLLIGTIGSGKSEASKLLVKNFGYYEINSGRVISRLLGIPAVPKSSRATFQAKALNLIHRKDGPTRIARAILEQVNKHPGKQILIDGLRHRATYDALLKQVQPARLTILYVHTLPDVAYQFYNQRAAKKITFEEFLRLRDAEVERPVHKFLGIADAVVYNWHGKGQYFRALKSLMTNLRSD